MRKEKQTNDWYLLANRGPQTRENPLARCLMFACIRLFSSLRVGGDLFPRSRDPTGPGRPYGDPMRICGLPTWKQGPQAQGELCRGDASVAPPGKDSSRRVSLHHGTLLRRPGIPL